MKKQILRGLSLAILISLALGLIIQPSLATGESISITKSGTFRIDSASGAWLIDYIYTVKNEGVAGFSHTLSNIYINDDKVGNNILTWPSLAPGESHTFPTVTYAVKAGDIDKVHNTVTNTATVYGTDLVVNPNRTFSRSTEFTCPVPGPNPPVPELPAGLLFGMGLAGIGGFVIFKRYRASAATR